MYIYEGHKGPLALTSSLKQAVHEQLVFGLKVNELVQSRLNKRR